MIRSLTIDNFRCFDHFELHDLGRINLIVGGNNSGNTSLLEAVELLSGIGEPTSVINTLSRRGEILPENHDGRTVYDVNRLIHGHSTTDGSFSLHGRSVSGQISCIGAFRNTDIQSTLFDDQPQDAETPEEPTRLFTIQWIGETGHFAIVAELTPTGGVTAQRLRRPSRNGDSYTRKTVRFITTASLSMEDTQELFDSVVLTPHESIVIDTLKLIEPTIVRIAPHTERFRSGLIRSSSRGGFWIQLSDMPERIPIGSMGDGIWRLLALILSLVKCKDGVVLIDEIDTGLHYTVMVKMWKMVKEIANILNIQVFATSHSRDCYEALAEVCRDDVKAVSDVTIQRIERGKKRAVAYSEREIVIAAERGLEVR